MNYEKQQNINKSTGKLDCNGIEIETMDIVIINGIKYYVEYYNNKDYGNMFGRQQFVGEGYWLIKEDYMDSMEYCGGGEKSLNRYKSKNIEIIKKKRKLNK